MGICFKKNDWNFLNRVVTQFDRYLMLQLWRPLRAGGNCLLLQSLHPVGIENKTYWFENERWWHKIIVGMLRHVMIVVKRNTSQNRVRNGEMIVEWLTPHNMNDFSCYRVYKPGLSIGSIKFFFYCWWFEYLSGSLVTDYNLIRLSLKSEMNIITVIMNAIIQNL